MLHRVLMCASPNINVPTRLAMGAVRAYQLILSPFLPRACRFEPSCSHYAITALSKYGLFRGAGLALKRLLRCHPFSGKSGWDPVP